MPNYYPSTDLWRQIRTGQFNSGSFEEMTDDMFNEHKDLIRQSAPFKDDKSLVGIINHPKNNKQTLIRVLMAYYHELQSSQVYAPISKKTRSLVSDVNFGPIEDASYVGHAFGVYYEHSFKLPKQDIITQQEFASLYLNSHDLSHFSTINGDGNCYYRSVYISYLEQILLDEDNRANALNLLADKIEKFQQPQYLGRLVKKLRKAARGECWTSIVDFHRDIVTPDNKKQWPTSYDGLLVMAMRFFNVHFIRQHLEEAVSPGGLTMRGYIEVADSLYEKKSDNSNEQEEDISIETTLTHEQSNAKVKAFLAAIFTWKEYVTDWVAELGFSSLLFPGCDLRCYQLHAEGINEMDSWERLSDFKDQVNYSIQTNVLQVPDHYIMVYNQAHADAVKASYAENRHLLRQASTTVVTDLYAHKGNASDNSAARKESNAPTRSS